MKIKFYLQKIKKNKIIDSILRILATPIFIFQYISNNTDIKKRKNGDIQDEYKWLLELKDTHKGERCFIVATGPSLDTKDLDLIKDEYSLSLNSIFLSFDKTKWRPNIYAIQDEYVFNSIKDNLTNNVNQFKELLISKNISSKFEIPYNYKSFKLHYLDHKMFHFNGYGHFKFSDDCYSCIYDAYSIVFTLMQLACYMGFKEIYLLGCDCNYNQKKAYFNDYGYRDPKFKINGDKQIQAHIEFKKFADEKGIKIINCTNGGALEVYPRMKLKDVISKEKNEK